MKLRPLSNRLAIKPDEKDEMFKDSIHIPDTVKYVPQIGRVIATGPGFMTDIPLVSPKDPTKIMFHRQPMHVKVGDRVFFGKNIGVELQIERDKFMVLRESDVLAILADDEDE